jgi:hypothetical protein
MVTDCGRYVRIPGESKNDSALRSSAMGRAFLAARRSAASSSGAVFMSSSPLAATPICCFE